MLLPRFPAARVAPFGNTLGCLRTPTRHQGRPNWCGRIIGRNHHRAGTSSRPVTHK
nr:MAG TPA: hypothetical protein [Caudoviricetes sp.]